MRHSPRKVCVSLAAAVEFTVARLRRAPIAASASPSPASIEQLEARQLLSGVAWLSSNSAATWDSSTGTLTVTGAATIIADPGADDPQVTVSGSGAQLTIEPSSDSVLQLGSLTLSSGGSAEITRPNATGFDPSSSLLVVVGTAGSSAALSIDSASGSTLALEDNDLIVRAGSANESAYLGGVTLGSPAVQPAEGQQNVLALAGDDDPSDGPIQMTAGNQSVTLNSGDVLIKYSDGSPLGADHSAGPADIGPAFPRFGAMDSGGFAMDEGDDGGGSDLTPAYVVSATVNGNLPSLIGAQRSMVDSMLYTFSEPVTLDPSDAFSLAVASGQSGTVPTLTWTAISPDGSGASAQWAVSFSGAGVEGNSIDDGVYDLSLNTSAVTSEANPTVAAQPHQPDLFYRLFGDDLGTGRVNGSDYNALLSTYGLGSGNSGFIPCLDFNADGLINSTDNTAFQANFNRRLTGTLSFSPTDAEPTDVSATANDPTSVTITWTAPATGTISGYDIQRWSAEDGAWITLAQNISASTTSYTDTTADPDTDYQYQVNAAESAGTSDWSETPAELTTPIAPPTNLAAAEVTAFSVLLTWTGPQGVTYSVYRDGQQIASGLSATSYLDQTVQPSSSYTYQVSSTGSSGDVSTYSTSAVATTPSSPFDIEPPSQPTGVSAGPVSGTDDEIEITWNPSHDDVGVTEYEILRNLGSDPMTAPALQVGAVTSTRFTDTNLSPSTEYRYEVVAFDAADNQSPAATITGTTGADQTPPTQPFGLTASAVTPSSATLSWLPSSDNVGIDHYEIEQDGVEVGTTSQTTFPVTGLTAASYPVFQVVAVDAVGNRSLTSASLQVPIPGPTSVLATPEGGVEVPAGGNLYPEAPNQYIPQEYQDYFYQVIVPAIDELDARFSPAAPPGAYTFTSLGSLPDSEYLLYAGNMVSLREANGNYYVDLNGDGQ